MAIHIAKNANDPFAVGECLVVKRISPTADVTNTFDLLIDAGPFWGYTLIGWILRSTSLQDGQWSTRICPHLPML